MTEEFPRKRSLGCLFASLFVLVFGGLAGAIHGWEGWPLTVVMFGMGGLGLGVYATVKAFGRGPQQRSTERAARVKNPATNAHRHRREWRRVGAVLSVVAAVLTTIPFERSVRMLLRAYEGAEWWDERDMRSIVVGWERFTGFPGLLHASAAVLMTAATIVLFTGLALLLASDVWMPGRRDTTATRGERHRQG